jgi:hypothetical protein
VRLFDIFICSQFLQPNGQCTLNMDCNVFEFNAYDGLCGEIISLFQELYRTEVHSVGG